MHPWVCSIARTFATTQTNRGDSRIRWALLVHIDSNYLLTLTVEMYATDSGHLDRGQR